MITAQPSKSGFGFADLENRVLASPSTVMRIASISKALTSVALGKLEEDKKIDLDRPITDFKIPAWTNSPDEITPRLLASHFAGIRHYEKNEEASKVDEKKTDANVTGEGEFYLNRPFRSVAEALEIFNKDPLLAKPGERAQYEMSCRDVHTACGELFPDYPSTGKAISHQGCIFSF